MSRTIVRSLLSGGEGTLAVPLALATAARIQERDWETFLEDPTQLANGIRDLVDAGAPDGVQVCDDAELLAQAAGCALGQGPHAAASVEATRRLRQTLGDRVALVAVLPGPGRVATAAGLTGHAAGEAVVELGQLYLAAGADVLLVRDEGESPAPLATLSNIARFHQALCLSYDGPAAGLDPVQRVPLTDPTPREGVVVTEGDVPRDTDFTLIEDWIDGVH